MPEGEFAYFHFTGGRFEVGVGEEPGMPLESLADLSVFRELVLEAAKHLWRLEHPGRQRTPKRFASDLDLRLRRVEGGSVVPIVERRQQVSTLDLDDHFENARDLLVHSVQRVSSGQSLPRSFPRSQVTRLSKFGARLNALERLDFGHPSDPVRRARIDVRTSELLRQLAVTLTTEQSDTRIRGYVAEIDGDLDTFQLRMSDGRRVGGAAYKAEDAEAIKDWLVVDGRDEVLVEVVGPALIDAEGEVLRFDGLVSVEEVPVLGVLAVYDALAKLAEHAELADRPVSSEVLQALNDRIERLSKRYPSLGFALTEEGAVRVEWETETGWDCSVDIDPDETIFMHRYNATLNEDWEREGRLDAVGWQRFDEFLGMD